MCESLLPTCFVEQVHLFASHCSSRVLHRLWTTAAACHLQGGRSGGRWKDGVPSVSLFVCVARIEASREALPCGCTLLVFMTSSPRFRFRHHPGWMRLDMAWKICPQAGVSARTISKWSASRCSSSQCCCAFSSSALPVSSRRAAAATCAWKARIMSSGTTSSRAPATISRPI